MRLSEKTIEINWCSQFTKQCPKTVFWFGLTQKQEAQAGFDTCTKIGGRLLIFQFKASNRVLKSGARQFQLNHEQLTKLQNRVKYYQRSIFYVFPSVGNTSEIAVNPNVLTQSQLLDVSTIPTLSKPTKKDGSLRKSKIHYVDTFPGIATIHSDPVEVRLEQSIELIGSEFAMVDGLNNVFESFNDFWEFRQFLSRKSSGVIIGSNNK